MLDTDSDRVRTHEYLRNQEIERLEIDYVCTIGQNFENDDRFSLWIVEI